MAWAEKQLKRNAFNEIVPQYFDEVLDDWVPYTGVYGEVTLSGNVVTEEVVINAQSVPAGGNTGHVDLGITNEIELVVGVSIDASPWTAGVTRWGVPNNYANADCIVPKMENITVRPGILNPRAGYITTFSSNPEINAIPLPASIEQARAMGITRPIPGQHIQVKNLSDQTATVTVRVLRYWRV